MKTITKSLLCLGLLMTFASCQSQWEYKVVRVQGESTSDSKACSYGDNTHMLNSMGKDGWELVSTYTEEETSFPNFGDSQYVTGIRDNTRTYAVNFVFKRKGAASEKETK